MKDTFTITKPMGRFTYQVSSVPDSPLDYEARVKLTIDSWLLGKSTYERTFTSSPQALRKSFQNYEDGALVQDAFPRLSEVDRDWIIMGSVSCT